MIRCCELLKQIDEVKYTVIIIATYRALYIFCIILKKRFKCVFNEFKTTKSGKLLLTLHLFYFKSTR